MWMCVCVCENYTESSDSPCKNCWWSEKKGWRNFHPLHVLELQTVVKVFLFFFYRWILEWRSLTLRRTERQAVQTEMQMEVKVSGLKREPADFPTMAWSFHIFAVALQSSSRLFGQLVHRLAQRQQPLPREKKNQLKPSTFHQSGPSTSHQSEPSTHHQSEPSTFQLLVHDTAGCYTSCSLFSMLVS